MGQRRRRVKGNLIWDRLAQLLDEQSWGARERLLAKLHLIAGQSGFQPLADMRANAISELKENICPDVLLFALADALRVNVYWLAGLSDKREPPSDVRRLLTDDSAPEPTSE